MTGEIKKWIKGEYYVPVVLRVEESDDNGRPFVCTTLYDEQVAELNPTDPSKNQFHIVWMREAVVRGAK